MSAMTTALVIIAILVASTQVSAIVVPKKRSVAHCRYCRPYAHASLALGMTGGPVTAKDAGTDFGERIESVKFVVTGVVVGSLASLPTSLILGLFNGFNSQWEVSHDALALTLAVYSLIYRYAYRENDTNPMQQMGVIGGLSAIRALGALQVDPTCTPFPITCTWFTWFSILLASAEVFIETSFVFYVTASVFETLSSINILKKLKAN